MQAHYNIVSHSVHEVTDMPAFVWDGDKLHIALQSSNSSRFRSKTQELLLRTRLALCVTLLTACATSSGAPSTTHPVTETARVTSGSQIGMDMMTTNTTHSVDVSAP